jgi:hypothetical protein
MIPKKYKQTKDMKPFTKVGVLFSSAPFYKLTVSRETQWICQFIKGRKELRLRCPRLITFHNPKHRGL